MIGLLRKDLYMMWAYCRTFLLMMLIFVLVGTQQSENAFFVIFPMIIGMMLPVSLISFDERFHWNRVCDALPCSRALAVSAKYLLTLLVVLTIFALILLAQGIRLAGLGKLAELGRLVPLLLPLGLLGPALLMPVIFALGVEKGRLAYFVLVGIVTAIGVTFGMSEGAEPLKVEAEVPGVAAVLVSAVLYAGSWLLSIAVYRRREL